METVRYANSMKRIGILGGTFDPVHNAHVELAQAALDQYSLDTVLFIPTGKPVRKLGRTHASAKHRLGMLQALCTGNKNFGVSSLEVERPTITYTIDTVRELKALYGDESELFLILGEDTVIDLATWKNAEEIARHVTILYARRSCGAEEPRLPQGFTCFEICLPVLSLSSSTIRSELSQGNDVQNLVPAEALNYLKKHGLYEQPGRNL